MPKLGMQEVRKEQIIKATMHCITTLGIHKSSMQKIADEAQINSSLIVHYFNDRSQLLTEVYMYLYQVMVSEVRWRLSTAITPRDKVKAICEAQLCDNILAREIVVTWVALFALIPELPSLARLDRIYRARVRSNLLHHLRRAGFSPDRARQVSLELPALIDGLWLRKAAEPTMSGKEMRSVVNAYLQCLGH